MSKQDVTKSKLLSLVLRHRPDTIGVKLDANGWIEVDALLTALAVHGNRMERSELDRIVAENDKQCFVFSDDGARIRAKSLCAIEDPDVLYEGRFLRVKKRGRWEYVERTRLSGIVAVLAVSEDDMVILIEQFRPPLSRIVVEIPAGLAGDENRHESLAEAARRELWEETGYEAREMEEFFAGPSSPGLTNESITFFRARNLRRTGKGHGDGSEQITRHEVPIGEIDQWLESRRGLGHLIDSRVYTALYFESRARRR